MSALLERELGTAISRMAHAKRTRDNVSLAYAADSSTALADCVTNAEVVFETAVIAVICTFEELEAARAKAVSP